MKEVLSVQNMRAGYDHRDVIRGLSFRVHDGDVVAVIGPNGSGKTTLLKAVLGMMALKAGSVRLFGREERGGMDNERRIAYIPQRLQFDSTFPISLREMLSLSTRGADIEKYLDMLELRPLLESRVGDLSGGQMQRALLAYAIIKDPMLLIMDEPTSWVDVRGADCILCLIEEFKARGIAMIMVSHDFAVLRAVSTHVLGLGLESYFFERADSPGVDEKIASLFGTTHHGKGYAPRCARCGETLAGREHGHEH